MVDWRMNFTTIQLLKNEEHLFSSVSRFIVTLHQLFKMTDESSLLPLFGYRSKSHNNCLVKLNNFAIGQRINAHLLSSVNSKKKKMLTFFFSILIQVAFLQPILSFFNPSRNSMDRFRI